jgi:hypothetical protein
MIVVILACRRRRMRRRRAGSASQPARGRDPRARHRSRGPADSVAVSLMHQRGCAALDQARRLNTAVDAAIAAGRVPAALQPQLQATATRLVAGIRAPAAATSRTEAAETRPPSRSQHHGPGQNDQGAGLSAVHPDLPLPARPHAGKRRHGHRLSGP